MTLIATNNVTAIIGMGITGQSVARYLSEKGQPFVWLDTRANPAHFDSILKAYPGLNYELGDLCVDTLTAVNEIVVSPGVSIDCDAIKLARAAGVSIVGDIELFIRENDKPLIAITGSNAKTTVTTLVGEMARAAGIEVAIGGNIGTPALDLLQQQDAQCCLLELSSFQLELIESLNADVAALLNISEDHMDRYANLALYHRAKQRVFYGAKKVILNRADPLTNPPLAEGVQRYSFALNQPDRNEFGLQQKANSEWLGFEFKALLPVSEVKMPGRHNLENSLAALAIGHAAGWPMEPMLQVLKTFKGLPHRCQWVAECDGVNFYNDSKGTNVGATLAALNGLQKESGKIVLIAGGVGKGANFSALAKPLTHARAVVLIGEDAEKIAAAVADNVECYFCDSLEAAVIKSLAVAQSGDDVLLSPACASFDMFSGFEDRGNAFVQAVKKVAA
jgi:UDP-N-acetylmuramoylalanine--D-glutamate ligase